jgi:hypothetical protein
MRVVGIAVALLVAAGIVATLRSIGVSDARTTTADAPAAYGSDPKGAEKAHAKPPPTQAIIAPNIPSHRNRSSCRECGVVESIRQIERSGTAGAMGTGDTRVDRGNARGASGGTVSTKATSGPAYEITVRFRDGSSTAFDQASPQPWSLGSLVIVVGRSTTPNN